MTSSARGERGGKPPASRWVHRRAVPFLPRIRLPPPFDGRELDLVASPRVDVGLAVLVLETEVPRTPPARLFRRPKTTLAPTLPGVHVSANTTRRACDSPFGHASASDARFRAEPNISSYRQSPVSS